MKNQENKYKVFGQKALNNRYVAMRHGESKANSLGEANGDPTRGANGFGLTDMGRQQVVDAATAFAGLDVDEHERIVPLNCAEIAALSVGMPLRFKEEGAG